MQLGAAHRARGCVFRGRVCMSRQGRHAVIIPTLRPVAHHAEELEAIRKRNPELRIKVAAHISYGEFVQLLRTTKIFISPLGCVHAGVKGESQMCCDADYFTARSCSCCAPPRFSSAPRGALLCRNLLELASETSSICFQISLESPCSCCASPSHWVRKPRHAPKMRASCPLPPSINQQRLQRRSETCRSRVALSTER